MRSFFSPILMLVFLCISLHKSGYSQPFDVKYSELTNTEKNLVAIKPNKVIGIKDEFIYYLLTNYKTENGVGATRSNNPKILCLDKNDLSLKFSFVLNPEAKNIEGITAFIAEDKIILFYNETSKTENNIKAVSLSLKNPSGYADYKIPEIKVVKEKGDWFFFTYTAFSPDQTKLLILASTISEIYKHTRDNFFVYDIVTGKILWNRELPGKYNDMEPVNHSFVINNKAEVFYIATTKGKGKITGKNFVVKISSQNSALAVKEIPLPADAKNAETYLDRNLDQLQVFLQLHGDYLYMSGIYLLKSAEARGIFVAKISPDDLTISKQTNHSFSSSIETRLNSDKVNEFILHRMEFSESGLLVFARGKNDEKAFTTGHDLLVFSFSPSFDLIWSDFVPMEYALENFQNANGYGDTHVFSEEISGYDFPHAPVYRIDSDYYVPFTLTPDVVKILKKTTGINKYLKEVGDSGLKDVLIVLKYNQAAGCTGYKFYKTSDDWYAMSLYPFSSVDNNLIMYGYTSGNGIFGNKHVVSLVPIWK